MDGLPAVSTYTIRCAPHDVGFTWDKDRSWCETGTAIRKRKSGSVTVIDPDATPKNVIEAGYARDALPVYTEDEAGPDQTTPYPGSHWHPAGHPVQYPHEYV